MNKDNIHGMDTCLKTNTEPCLSMKDDTNGNIRLSIIIPAYNAENYIENCLDTILKNNFQDTEIIVINDGSTDNTDNILKKYAKESIPNFRVIHKTNGGVSSARNIGINYASGEWITFVDADDFATKELVSFIPDSHADLYCFNWKYTTGERENEDHNNMTYWGEKKEHFLSKHLVDYIFRTPWAKYFRRDIIRNNNIYFNETFKIGEDNLFILDYLFYCNTIATVNSIGYIYLRPPKGKYPLQFKTAVNFMTLFMEKYNRLNINCIPLLQLLNLYYFMSLQDNSLKMRIAWEKTPAIRHIHKICWSTYGKKERFNIKIYKIISFFYV